MKFLLAVLFTAICLNMFKVNSQPVLTHPAQTKITKFVPELQQLQELVIPELQDLLSDLNDELYSEGRFNTFNPISAGLLPIF